MPFDFPLSFDDFLSRLPISDMTMECPEVVETSQTAGAEVLTDMIGNRYWQGEIKLDFMTRDEKREVQVLIDAVRSGGSFFVHDVTQEFPLEDPLGAVAAGLSPTISTLSSDARLIGLQGLPGYTLRRGDYLAFEYRSNPVRFALHRVAEAEVVAQGSGFTGLFEVQPHIQPGAVTGTPVQLIRPACKAIILPDSVKPGSTNRFIHTGMSFSYMQTLR